jgi:hypothetical protein
LSGGHCFIFDRYGLRDAWSFALVKLFHVDLVAAWACDWRFVVVDVGSAPLTLTLMMILISGI